MFPNFQILGIAILISLILGFGAGYKVKTMQVEADKAKTLEIESERQSKISTIVDQVVTKTIDDSKQAEVVTKIIEKEVVKYVPKIQLVNSECNLTNGVVRLLNSHSSNQMPITTSATTSTDTAPSDITEKEHIDYTNEIIDLYNKASVQSNALIQYNLEVSKLNP